MPANQTHWRCVGAGTARPDASPLTPDVTRRLQVPATEGERTARPSATLTIPAVRRRSWVEAALVLTAGTALAIITTWPLARSIDTLAHDPFDPLFQAWTIDWVQHALGSPAPLWEANTFRPNQRTLAYSDSLIGAAIVLLPLRWLGRSPLGVHNIGLLAAYASTFCSGYFFGKVVSRRVVVATFTGLAFAFGTYGTFLGQHFNIALHPGAALAAAAAWILADRRADGARWWPSAAAITVAIALQGTVSFYTAAIAMVAVAAVLAAREPSLGWRGVGIGLAATAAAVVPLLLLAWPYILNARALSGDFEWELAEFAFTGANFFTVDPALTVWGDILPSEQGLLGQPAFPGVVLLVLAAVGVLRWRATADTRLHRTATILIGVGVVLGVGTSNAGWRRYAPYRLIFEFVPGGTALRGTGRFWLVGLLGLGLLAGVGAGYLAGLVRSRLTRSRSGMVAAAAAVAVLSGAVLVEGHQPWGDGPRVSVPAVDRELARRDDGGGVVYLPLPIDRRVEFGLQILGQARVLYGTTAHHRPTPNGYAGFFPESFFEAGPALADLPGRSAVAWLRRRDIRYVVVAEGAVYWEDLRDPERAAPLRLVGDYEGDLLYEVPTV